MHFSYAEINKSHRQKVVYLTLMNGVVSAYVLFICYYFYYLVAQRPDIASLSVPHKLLN